MTTVLGAEQVVPRRPFTNVAKYQRDIGVLNVLLADLRAHLEAIDAEIITPKPYQRTSWKVRGLTRRIVLSDPDRLRGPYDVYFVGFFSDRHPDVDIGPLEKANSEVVREFRKFPAIISYSSAQLPCTNWANLVLNENAEAAEHWRTSKAHQRAVDDLSPQHYRNVRIHIGRLGGGIHSGNPLEIQRTKYYDYGSRAVWQAVRELNPPG